MAWFLVQFRKTRSRKIFKDLNYFDNLWKTHSCLFFQITLETMLFILLTIYIKKIS